MYKRQTAMTLKGTASMLPNNLVVHMGEHLSYAVVHKSVVCVNTVFTSGNPVQKQLACKGEGTGGNSTVMQVKWCTVSDRVVLVIASAKGIQMFEQDGSIMIFWHTVPQPQEDKALLYFARGICAVSQRFMCVGTSNGTIMVFDIPSEGTAVKLQETIEHHKVGITDLTSHEDHMVSGDEDGNIIIWQQCDEKSKQIHTIRGAGIPCMNLALWNGLIIAGYSSGHIRIFDMMIGIIKVEIFAHSRCINGLDIAPSSALLLSVSEDSFARVWSLPKDDSNKVELVFQCPVRDSELCGGRFLDECGESFAVCGYDLAEVIVYAKK